MPIIVKDAESTENQKYFFWKKGCRARDGITAHHKKRNEDGIKKKQLNHN